MEIIKETLPSGLTVILVPMAGTKSITEVFIVRAGWKYEWPEIYGLSHFIEHMAFRRTNKRPTAEAIVKEVEGRGGTINALTIDEYTFYCVKIPARFINTAHDIISDMLLNSKFDQEEIDIERGPILEELHMNQDDPGLYVSSTLWPKLLYKNQPAGQNGLGTEENLKGLKRKHFFDYLRKLYVASNSAVCVTGKIENPGKVLNDLNKYFRKISQEKPKIKKPRVIERQKKPKILFEPRETTQTHVVLGVRGYSIFHPGRYAFKMLGIILGGNMSSRMFREVRDKRGLAYDIHTDTYFQTDAGWLATYAGLNSEKIIEALQVIIGQYREISKKEVSQEELRIAKDFILGQMEMGLENSDALALYFSEQFVLTGQIETPEERIQKFESVTAGDILRVAQDIFQNKSLNLAIVGPHRKLKEKLYSIIKF